MDELPPHLFGGDGPDEEAERVVAALAGIWGVPRWRITDDRTAEWVMSKLRAAQAELDEAEAIAAEYRSRIADWLESRTRRAVGTRKWAEAHLTRYLEDLHAADPKVKSRPLPSGRISSTAGRFEWVVADEGMALAAVQAAGLQDELVVPAQLVGPQRLAQVLDVDEPNEAAVTKDGTIVAGLVVRRRPRTFTAKPS